ncbi:alpha/beta hydrolase [Rheinheimera maricola]|uniref:Esterase family protein n=1 Tax=Rheinheimera maricola TaxID=2793282 RepID=A0ABS7X901_9GAMM|nr:alpha/beta hydrolase-fold protein [Rheinheimera maricola]MBZ9611645.1 esterase family protein [Rheinheimera maricola]
MTHSKIILTIAAVLTLTACADKNPAVASLTIKVTPPADYSASETIHLVGSFNDWALEGDQAYPLSTDKGELSTTIPVTEKNVFFTLVKNKNWQLMPANEMAKSQCIYLHQATGDDAEMAVHIPLWTGDKPLKTAEPSLSGNIVQHKDFTLPQFARSSDIDVYLPKSYQHNPDKTYPVLYMLDGQNIFNAQSAHSDEWRIDELLEQLTAAGTLDEMIVVAVPNSVHRWVEYNPWDFKDRDGKAAQGQGELTIRSIKDTLKPFIDSSYRTKPQSANTGLAGSSLGGLMAIYAALAHSDTFGFTAAFSPALAVENMHGKNVLFEAIKQQQTIGNSKIYFDMGQMEYGNYEQIEQLNSLLLKQGFQAENLKLVKDDLGRHCEVDWSRRFPGALKWLQAGI